MEQVTIYHNPRCSKSRAALALLQQRGVEPQVILYLQTPPDAATLRRLIARLGLAGARDLMRRGEDLYKQLNLADERLSEAQLIEALVSHPRLIERPIVLRGERACIGRPPENVLQIL